MLLCSQPLYESEHLWITATWCTKRYNHQAATLVSRWDTESMFTKLVVFCLNHRLRCLPVKLHWTLKSSSTFLKNCGWWWITCSAVLSNRSENVLGYIFFQVNILFILCIFLSFYSLFSFLFGQLNSNYCMVEKQLLKMFKDIQVLKILVCCVWDNLSRVVCLFFLLPRIMWW